MSEEARYPSYVAIWVWLVAFLVAGLFCAFLPFGKTMAIFRITSYNVCYTKLLRRVF